jgi:hypothetical protein
MSAVELSPVELPEFGIPTVQPTLTGDTYARRLAMARERAEAAQLDALVVYGDREHFANLAYLTGYDPRFEEALLILVPGQEAKLVVGLEGRFFRTRVSRQASESGWWAGSILTRAKPRRLPRGSKFRRLLPTPFVPCPVTPRRSSTPHPSL